ncbi:MAG: hypothetical protein QOJ70_590 [Acidobacteriota bacterium]|jgi:hypothetical protein|nr:hypothetical protein [Acidobacteriota bacterium]
MPRSRARKHKDRNRIARTQRRFISHPVLRKIISKITLGKMVAVMVAMIGVVGSYVTIFGYWSPRISVQPLQRLNPRDALSTEFSVTNQGALPIYNVDVGCEFKNFILAAPNFPGKEIFEVIPLNSSYESISPMQSTTVKVPFSLPDEKVLDIAIVIYYRPAWYPFRRREAFRFVTKVAADGQIHWLPRPDSTPRFGAKMPEEDNGEDEN